MRIAALGAIFLIACAGPGLEPPSNDGLSPTAGNGGVATGGSGGTMGNPSGGSGGDDVGGQGGSAGAVAGGAGGMGAGEQSSSGEGGQSGMDALDAGVIDDDSGEPLDRDTGWSDACGSVTNSGHCVEDVYEWCDYYARGLSQLDCAELGMTCRAVSPAVEGKPNGCVREPCVPGDDLCDGSLLYDCSEGELLAIDCRKEYGPESSCELFHDTLSDASYLRCTRDQPCDTPNVLWCDQELEVICDEDGKQYIIDCQASDPDGRCDATGPEARCDPP